MHKRLIFRLSSLGDVILASSVLNTRLAQEPVDWVVATEFAPLLRGHPRIRKLWEFDRSSGLSGWLQLCRKLKDENYDEVFDLHSTLRTRVARLCFLGPRSPRWRTFSKERWKLIGLFLFKGFWPWRPSPFVERFTQFVGGTGQERPDLRHLLTVAPERSPRNESAFPQAGQYFCVMPGSRWQGKRWPVSQFVEALERAGVRAGTPVILGSKKDSESSELVEKLQSKNHPAYSGVGRWDLPQTAHVLALSCGYIGNDTGLAHLAEALGVPALVIFGPTSPEMGFGPWRPESAAACVKLGCRPCGKDGRRCYRPVQKYLCMTQIDTDEVAHKLVAQSQARQLKLNREKESANP